MVGFRYFTRKRARELGVKGSVRNLPDGSVEVMASAPDEIFNGFLKELKSGPSGAYVKDVEVDAGGYSGGAEESFSILYR